MISPSEITKNYIGIGKTKAEAPWPKVFMLAIMAGIFIAFAGVGATTAGVTVESASVAKLMGACIFPAGLAMVLIAGSELFTGNSLIVVACMEKEACIKQMLYNWTVVYIGNFVGAMLVVLMLVYGHTFSLFDNQLAFDVVSIAKAKVSLTFTEALLRGIMCNLLVCLAVWMACAATTVSGKIIGLFFPIMLFVLCGYEHCIANMYYIPAGLLAMSEYGIACDGLTWGSFIINSQIPVTIGNIIGGVAIGLVYWLAYIGPCSKSKAK